ncbi:MAG: hypothetical protein ACSHWY_03435 [Octadecabacter sp.]
MTSPVWKGAETPPSIAVNHNTVLEKLKAQPAWDFWVRFYEGMWQGTFTEWDLAIEVIEINEADWEKGYEHIGEVIAGIEARMRGEPLDQDALTKHLGQVINFPTVHHDFAAGTSLQISNAVATYKQEAPANCLPDGFEQFEQLPKAFGSIAEAIASDDDKDAKITALQAEVNKLYSIITQLRLDLSDAHVALANKKLDAVEVAQMRTFGEKAQTFLTNITLMGAIGMGAFTFFGVDEDELKYEALKVQLDELTNQMQAVEATESIEVGP